MRPFDLLWDIERLLEVHGPARDRFESIRAVARESVDARRSLRDLRDWADLCHMLGHEDEVLGWYDAHKDNPRDKRAVQTIASGLYTEFLERERWVDLGKSIRRPVDFISSQVSAPDRMAEQTSAYYSDHEMTEAEQRMIEAEREAAKQRMLHGALNRATIYHTALLAADREVEALRVAGVLFDTLEGERLASAKADLARHALNAGHPHPKHIEWLEGAGDASLLKRVRDALAQR